MSVLIVATSPWVQVICPLIVPNAVCIVAVVPLIEVIPSCNPLKNPVFYNLDLEAILPLLVSPKCYRTDKTVGRNI